MADKAFSGVKVLEYAQFVAGPYCTKLLADLGAEVIKIEPPSTGDEARHRGPFPKDIPHPERSFLFLYLNTNKLGITLNPKTAAGRKIFRELVKGADILVEDTPPGTMNKWRLGYESLSRFNPRLIMTSITPFGQTGPYRHYKAHPLNIYHGGGLGYMTPAHSPYPNREPLASGGFMGEYACGLTAAVATLGALYAQRSTGLGRQIDISKQEAVIGICRVQAARYANEGMNFSRTYMTRGFGDLMPCRDGYVVIMNNEEHQWRALVELMGNPDWARDKRLEDGIFRDSHWNDMVSPFLLEWLSQHTKEEIYHRGQALGSPASPVMTPEEVLKSEQMKARGFFAEVDHPGLGKGKYPLTPYRLSQTPAEIEHIAPLLGQHNEEIYVKRLGYTKDDLTKMREAGVL